jgi:opacity protein-like surface antigen
MKKRSILAGLVLCATLAAPAGAVDGVAVEIGSGDSTDMGRIAVQWDWGKRWFQGKDWHLGGYWDLALGYWDRGGVLPGQNDGITEIGLTPVFRLQPNSLTGPYLEAAIGFHLLSRTSLGDKRFSTQFQFGDHIGFGYRFGARNAFDIGYRFQHLSNGSIKKPNNGIDFHQVRLQYRF